MGSFLLYPYSVDHSRHTAIKYGDGLVDRVVHQGTCPFCEQNLLWQVVIVAYAVGDDGSLTPDIQESGSWSAYCDTCQCELLDPYEDGLIHVYSDY